MGHKFSKNYYGSTIKCTGHIQQGVRFGAITVMHQQQNLLIRSFWVAQTVKFLLDFISVIKAFRIMTWENRLTKKYKSCVIFKHNSRKAKHADWFGMEAFSWVRRVITRPFNLHPDF